MSQHSARRPTRRPALIAEREDATPLTVAIFLTSWLESRRSLRPSTAVAYEIHLRRHLLPALGHLPLQRLRTEHIDALYAELLAGRSGAALSVSTVRRVHATLMSALNAAVRRGLLARNPARFVELPPVWPHSARTWTADELARFLDANRTDRLFALMMLLALTGLRRGEGVGLRWVDVDLDGRSIRVEQQIVAVAASTHAGPPKSAHGRRTVAISDLTAQALAVHRFAQAEERRSAGPLWQDTGLVFTDPCGHALSPAAVSRRFERMAAGCGLPVIRLHDLRHTSASLGLASGESLFEVSRRLGHSSIGVTADTYAHLVPAVSKASADRLAASLRSRPDPRP